MLFNKKNVKISIFYMFRLITCFGALFACGLESTACVGCGDTHN